mgnify:CR=1 FL=1
MLLKLPGVSTRRINGLDAYFVSDRMFACISGHGVGLRLPASTATELQFSRDNVVPFQPGGIESSREWIQIDRSEAADYEKDLELLRASLEFVKAGRTRQLGGGANKKLLGSGRSGQAVSKQVSV